MLFTVTESAILPIDHPDVHAYLKLRPHADDGIINLLRGCRDDSELYWMSLQPYLASRGYRLRPRYSPSWVPSWAGKVGPDFSFSKYEDSLIAPTTKTLDARRDSDGAEVVLKIVRTDNQEIGIGQYLSSPECRSDPRNHAVPILDLLPIPDHEAQKLIVMPKLVPFNAVPFRFLGDVVEALRQFTETLQFMHEKGIAHRDACRFNLMADCCQLFPHGSHFVLWRSYDGVSKDFTKYQERSKVKGLRYYLTDFGLSLHYPPDTKNPTTVGTVGQDRTVPELSNSVPYNPFMVDVYQLGKAFKNLLEEYDKRGVEPLIPLLDSMSAPKPEDRYKPREILQHISRLKKAVLKKRIWKLEADERHRRRVRYLGEKCLLY